MRVLQLAMASVALSAAQGCGGQASWDDGGAGASGRSGAMSGGASAVGGSNSDGASSGQGGTNSGGASSGGPGATAGGGALPSPLYADEAALAASGAALVDLLAAIGLARGDAVCGCAYGSRAEVVTAETLAACAKDESGPLRALLSTSGRLCAAEAAAARPEFEATWRCVARRVQADGRGWAERCADMLNGMWPPFMECPGGSDPGAALERCARLSD